jgi:hypothetical protein
MDEQLPTAEHSLQSLSLEVAKMLEDKQRPSPHNMAALIQAGLTEEDILAAGEARGWQRPVMELTLEELDTDMPYLLALADHLAAEPGNKQKIFLARDGELLADVYAITHPDKPSQLLPASVKLWEWMQDANSPLTEKFLVDNHLALNGSSELIETGYKGRVGALIWGTLQPESRSNADALREAGSHLPIRMISTLGSARRRWGEQIVDFNQDELLANPELFPKVNSVIGPYDPSERRTYQKDPVAYRVAMSLQLMPHFTGTYERLEATEDGVRAVPSQEPIRDNVDEVLLSDEADGRNASIVNPLVALVLQHRVVRASMIHAGRLP